jgi:hypothetical protein
MNASTRRLAACMVVFALGAASAHAETIFRCGASYSQAPCPDASTIEVAAPVSAAQRAEARAVAAREKALALEMVRDRRERERALHPAMAGSLSPAPAAAPVPAAVRKHSPARKRGAAAEDGRDFVAVVPKAKS